MTEEGRRESTQRMRPPGVAGKIAMSLIAAVVVYANVAVTFRPVFSLPALSSLFRGVSPPVPFVLHDVFQLGGMFTSYAELNSDYVVQGLSERVGPDGGPVWRTLAVREFFPQRSGFLGAVIGAFHHWDVLGADAEHQAWTVLAHKIKDRQNRLHPDQPISRVRFGVERWPVSPLGFYAAKNERTLSYQVWYWE